MGDDLPHKKGFIGRKRVDLVQLARTQRLLLYAIALALAIIAGQIMTLVYVRGPARSWMLEGAFGAHLALGVAMFVLAARMARNAGVGGMEMGCLWCAMLVPYVNIFILAGLNQRVLMLLRQGNVRIGLLGVPRSEMNKLIEGACKGCGYDLRGLERGVCPECGMGFAPPEA